MENESKTCPTCGRGCCAVTGILIALFGLTFLLGNLGVLSANLTNIIWPCLLILTGIAFACKKRHSA